MNICFNYTNKYNVNTSVITRKHTSVWPLGDGTAKSHSANNLGSNGHLLSMQGTNYGGKVYRCDVRRRFRRVTSDMFVLV